MRYIERSFENTDLTLNQKLDLFMEICHDRLLYLSFNRSLQTDQRLLFDSSFAEKDLNKTFLNQIRGKENVLSFFRSWNRKYFEQLKSDIIKVEKKKKRQKKTKQKRLTLAVFFRYETRLQNCSSQLNYQPERLS